MTDSYAHFTIESEISRLKHGAAWKRSGYNAKVLAKQPHLRVLLTVMNEEAAVPSHKVDERLSIQVLSGRLHVRLNGRGVDLPAGDLLIVEPGVEHGIKAAGESAFLLSIAWPSQNVEAFLPELRHELSSAGHASSRSERPTPAPFRPAPASPSRPWKML